MDRRQLTLALAAASAGCAVSPRASGRPVVLLGATVVDVSGAGRAARDLDRAAVVLQGDRIVAVGPADQVRVPADAEVMETQGRYIVPGYIDAYCGMASQAQAHACLYMGVTGVVAKGDSRRGPLFTAARPGPRIFEIATAGVEITERTPEGLRRVDAAQRLSSLAETEREIEAHARRGIAVLHLLYPLPPAHVRLIVRRAREFGLGTVAELGATSYAEAADAGVASFVHAGRYLSELAPRDWVAGLARDAFGGDAVERVTRLVESYDSRRPELAAYGRLLASHRTGLIATLSATYPSLPDRRNLWQEPAAALLNPSELHIPPDRTTGRPWTSPRTGRPVGPHLPGVAEQFLRLTSVLHAQGARHLAGSGAPALGTLPGISLHTELEMLVRAGLTPREALAAATSNIAEAYGWRDVGRIAPGARADLLVLDADPRRDIANAKAIGWLFVAGARIDRAALLRTS